MLTPMTWQVFALLVLEMSIFGLLIIPLPYSMKRKLFTFISDSPIIAKMQYGMKVVQPAPVQYPKADVLTDYVHLHLDSLH